MAPEGAIRVLIVDDINDTRESVKRMLQFDKAIEVVGTARTGKEAIEQAQSLKPDVILMDINMPDMDGITATETIRRKYPYMQVIVLSVQNDPDYMRRAMRAGAHDFLPKPPMIDELTSTIKRGGEIAIQERAKTEQELLFSDAAGSRDKNTGNIIVVYSPKGGSGCTLIASNLAITMALQNKHRKVALIDGSLQYGDVPIYLKLQIRNSMVDLTTRVEELDSEVVEDVMAKHESSGLYVLAAPPRPEMADRITGEEFGKLLVYLKNEFDYIIIDTASYLTDITLRAMEMADHIILITTQDLTSIKSSSAYLTLMDQLDIDRQNIIFIMNRFDKRISGITPEKIGERLRQPILLTIPADEKTTVIESINKGIPLIPDSRSHPVGKGIIQLFNIIKERIATFEKNREED